MSVLSRSALSQAARGGASRSLWSAPRGPCTASQVQSHGSSLRYAALSARNLSSRPQLLEPLAISPRLFSQHLPPSIHLLPSASARHFSFAPRNSQKKDAQDDVKESSKASTQGEDGNKSETKSEEGEKQQGEGEGEGEEAKDKKKKKDAPPPPPHGDKSPWQVFTETLQSEFKKSKEWNESTKQLGGAVQDFTQNETVRRMREGYTSASGVASSTTSKVLKGTGQAIGQGAAWTWNTMPVKGLRAGASATASGLEKITRPVRETEAFKSVANVIDDGSSSRYGGWTEKEDRRKKREAREAAEAAKSPYGRRQRVEADPDAGTNITLHKDAKWKESWREFKDSSKIMQGLSGMRSVYNESENPLISTARSISDRVAGWFAENETAQVIKKFREIDPNFQLEPFLQEMREYILPDVLEAYVKGDIETLKNWLSAAQFQVYQAVMDQYIKAGLKSDGKILDIRNVDMVSARLLDPGEIPVFILSCRTQEVHVYRNAKSGELAAGMEDRVQQVTYAIGVTRIPEDVSNPETRGWRLIELQKSARDFL